MSDVTEGSSERSRRQVVSLRDLPRARDGGVPRLLDFHDLTAMGVVENRTQLARLQERRKHPFPKGRWLGANSIRWIESEIAQWVRDCPIDKADAVDDEAAA